MSEWISVKDELPENCDAVLIFNNSNMECVVTIAIFSDYYGGFYLIELKEVIKVNDLSHWMPLPKPPISSPNEEGEITINY